MVGKPSHVLPIIYREGAPSIVSFSLINYVYIFVRLSSLFPPLLSLLICSLPSSISLLSFFDYILLLPTASLIIHHQHNIDLSHSH